MQLRDKKYPKEAALIEGVYSHKVEYEYELFKYCSDYFYRCTQSVFFIKDEEVLKEIFQNSIIILWHKIETHEIYVEQNVIKCVDGSMLRGSLLTYFIGIAKNKNAEYVRQTPVMSNLDDYLRKTDNNEDIEDVLYENNKDVLEETILDLLSHMSKRCYQLLTMYYYDEMSIEDILQEIPSLQSSNAVKTRKYKCLQTLKKLSKDILLDRFF